MWEKPIGEGGWHRIIYSGELEERPGWMKNLEQVKLLQTRINCQELWRMLLDCTRISLLLKLFQDLSLSLHNCNGLDYGLVWYMPCTARLPLCPSCCCWIPCFKHFRAFVSCLGVANHFCHCLPVFHIVVGRVYYIPSSCCLFHVLFDILACSSCFWLADWISVNSSSSDLAVVLRPICLVLFSRAFIFVPVYSSTWHINITYCSTRSISLSNHSHLFHCYFTEQFAL